ncbi:MAG: FAD:protein transferase [Nocardioidaceae bacterium]|nr:FAD:protein transferase [Nocardioidaceae bacterium]
MTVDQPVVPLHRYVEHLMGMPISLALRGRHVDDEAAHDAWRRCLDSLRVVDATFSTYRDDSFLSRLNRGEVTADDGPPEVREVLDLGERARLESGGAFDVRRVGADGTSRLDPDGVVKGWAVQRAAVAFADLPDTDYCLSAGGDMVCHVADDTRPAWRIGIEDPHDPSTLAATVEVRHGAVATSGHAHRGQHVVDARTGAAPAAVASVTVLADDLTWADLDATAAYALGPEALAWLRGRIGRRGLVIWDDGRSDVFGDPT